MDPRPPREPRDTAAVALAGLGVGAALYPLTFILSQVFASSCRVGGLDSLGWAAACWAGWPALCWPAS